MTLYVLLYFVSLKRDDERNCPDPPLSFEHQKEERVSVEWGWMDVEVGELKKKWCERGKGGKKRRENWASLADCDWLCSVSGNSGRGTSDGGRRGGEKDKGIMPPSRMCKIQLKTYRPKMNLSYINLRYFLYDVKIWFTDWGCVRFSELNFVFRS